MPESRSELTRISTGKLILRLFRYLRLQQRVVAVAALFAIAKALFALGFVALSRWLLNNHLVLSTDTLKTTYVVLGILLLVYLVIIYFRVYLPAFLSNNVIRQLRHELYRHLQRLSADFYGRHQVGEIVSRLTNDITMAQLLFSTVLINVLFDITTLSVAFVYLTVTYPFQVYLPVVLVCLLYGVLMQVYLPRIRDYSHDVQERMGAITGDVFEKISGMRVLQSFTREEMAGQMVDEKLHSHYFASLQLARNQSAFSAVAQFLPEVAQLVVIAIGIFAIAQNRLTAGDVTGLILILGHVFFPLKRSATTTTEVGVSIGALERVFEFFDAQPSVIETSNPTALGESTGKVEYRNVSFRYPDSNGDTPVLGGISFTVEPGKQVVFVGLSGAGKTTIVDLLSRFYDPQDGTIFIDDIDIRLLSLESLRRNVGVVMQDTILFSGSIADNVRIGRSSATDADILDALDAAYALEFVEKMPRGVNAVIGESGSMLSGGQRQRLALARLFLKNPRIIVLDEATSALDAESEYYIMQALQRLKANRSILMIAHRLNRLAGFDQIFVVDRGRIVENGTFDELMKLDGQFAHLYNQQKVVARA